jgi:hypothetical protein
MRKRLFATTAAVTLALSFGAVGVTGVALAGEDDTVPPPAETPPTTVTVPVPGPTQTVTVPVPGPTETVTVQKPAPKKKKESGGSGGSGNSGSTNSGSTNTSSTADTRESAALTFTGSTVDTGTVPTGGIQAGAGGTAADDGTPVLLALSLGLLAFGLTSGGVALRRRASEH